MEEPQIIELLNERSEQGIDELRKKYGRLLRQISFNIRSCSLPCACFRDYGICI